MSCRVVLRGSALVRLDRPDTARPGDIIHVMPATEPFGRMELGSPLFVCVEVADASPPDFARYVAGLPANADGSSHVLKHAYGVELGKLGIAGAAGVHHVSRARFEAALARRQQVGDKLYIGGLR